MDKKIKLLNKAFEGGETKHAYSYLHGFFIYLFFCPLVTWFVKK